MSNIIGKMRLNMTAFKMISIMTTIQIKKMKIDVFSFCYIFYQILINLLK
jgi:ribosomal protein L31